MIELNEKASNYAEENVINVLKEAFAKVYADGYRDGYKDREDEIPVDLKQNQTEFVDLGLPSGTMWSSDYEKDEDGMRYFPYDKANVLGIPTKNQWEELKKLCRWEFDSDGSFKIAYCIGPNGNVLKFGLTGLKRVDTVVHSSNTYFWIKDEKDGPEKSAVSIYNDQRGWNTMMTIRDVYSGYKLAIRLVTKP